MLIKAIETTYKGCQFRSRLEATWACFFDFCGWQWVYEPEDFNGYIPDFYLIGESETVLVEVKPIVMRSFFDDGSYERFGIDWGEPIKKIYKSGSVDDQKEIVLLGLNTVSKESFGYLGDFCPNEQETLIPSCLNISPYINFDCEDPYLHNFCDAIWGRVMDDYSKIDFCHALNSYQSRMFDYYDGTTPSIRHNRELIEMFNNAKSLVKWTPKEQNIVFGIQ